jgi:MFS transporter, DHA1 family, inner membrane transport protein
MKSFLGNQSINYLIIHAVLHRLAWGGSSVFIGVYLYREGVSLAGIFLSYSAILALRFVFRSLLMPAVGLMGTRRALILGTFLQAVQYPTLAFVHGVGPMLALFCAASALGAAFYFTCYHAFFSALGDARHRGLQVGVRQVLTTASAVLGPALGGVALTAFGPWAAFGAAGMVELAAIVPLLALPEVDARPNVPLGGFAALKTGAYLFATDGWISNIAILAWSLIMFRALDARFDVLGGALAAAALAGAAFGAVLGRFIDLGHARKAMWFSATAFGLNLVIKAVCGEDPVVVVTVAILTSLLTGFYTPTLLTAFYNQAKLSPSPLRYQIFAEGAWDAGGVLVMIVAAAMCAMGAPLQATLLLALAVVPIQASLLHSVY